MGYNVDNGHESFLEETLSAFAGQLIHKINQIGVQILCLLSFSKIFDDFVCILALRLSQVFEKLEKVDLHFSFA
jgi:hypothetical protein